MNYLSANDMAQKWGISRVRVCTLARQGRIAGALLVGKSWVIPEDAPKPVDARTTEAQKNRSEESEASFRFPLYRYQTGDDGLDLSTLNGKERELYKAECLFAECRFEEAYDALTSILCSTNDYVIRIGALYLLILTSYMLNLEGTFKESLHEFNLMFCTDFPHKDELFLLVRDLETYFSGNSNIVNVATYSLSTKYHPSLRNYLYASSAYTLFIRSVLEHRAESPEIYELVCHSLEDNNSLMVAQVMHCYLAAYYYSIGNRDLGSNHIRSALTLGYQSKDYFLLGVYYGYLRSVMDEFLKEFPEEFSSKIREVGELYFKRFHDFLKQDTKTLSLSTLTTTDYEFIAYAVSKYTSKQIANEKGISISTVNNRYADIFEKLNIHSKKELVELIEKLYYKIDSFPNNT